MKKQCRKINSVVIMIVFAFFALLVACKPLEDHLILRRDVDSNEWTNFTVSSIKPPPRICHGNTPCGWAAYNKTNVLRRIEYFMKNTCECSPETKCLSDEDDISLAAYVYRCKRENKDKS